MTDWWNDVERTDLSRYIGADSPLTPELVDSMCGRLKEQPWEPSKPDPLIVSPKRLSYLKRLWARIHEQKERL